MYCSDAHHLRSSLHSTNNCSGMDLSNLPIPVADPLAARIWDNFLGWHCYREQHDRHGEVVTVPLWEVVLNVVWDVPFATFCMILRVYVHLRRDPVIIQFDRSSLERVQSYFHWSRNVCYSLETCSDSVVDVFRFYFPDSVEVDDALEQCLYDDIMNLIMKSTS